MDKTSIRSIISILIILLIAAGLAFAGSQGGFVVSGVPLFALCVALAFIIQWIVFIPAYIRRTEKFFDPGFPCFILNRFGRTLCHDRRRPSAQAGLLTSGSFY